MAITLSTILNANVFFLISKKNLSGFPQLCEWARNFLHWVLERFCLLTLTLRNEAKNNLLSGLYSLWQSLLLNVYKQSPSFQPINNELLLYLLESHKLGPKSVFHTGLPSVNLHLLTVATHTWLSKKLSEILYFRQTQIANHTQIKINYSHSPGTRELAQCIAVLTEPAWEPYYESLATT